LDHHLPVWDQDQIDANNLYDILENKVIPTYYDNSQKWQDIAFNGIDGVIPEFTSHRMAIQYYKKLF
jgi:starch phosphorylase